MDISTNPVRNRSFSDRINARGFNMLEAQAGQLSGHFWEYLIRCGLYVVIVTWSTSASSSWPFGPFAQRSPASLWGALSGTWTLLRERGLRKLRKDAKGNIGLLSVVPQGGSLLVLPLFDQPHDREV
jgi:hypothetical protein